MHPPKAHAQQHRRSTGGSQDELCAQVTGPDEPPDDNWARISATE
jgi:hypothetical protein